MANFLPPAIIEIRALADKAIAEFKEVNKELDKMEGSGTKASAGIDKMQKASKLATGALLGMGAAFAGFAAIGVKEAIEAEQGLNKLGSTMSALGVNTEANREKISALTNSYVDLGFSGDAAVIGFEKLLRVTGDTGEAQKLLALSADLARTETMSLEQASRTLAKASKGNAKAFKDMGIELDTTLPKSEAIAKAMDELNAKIGKNAENATKTFAVQLEIVKERFNDTAEAVGAYLLPILKNLLDRINKGIEFIKKHATAFKILAGVVITITVALAAYNATVKVQMALTKAWTVITGIQAAVTKLLTGQQIALNTAMKLNPIGLVVSAAMLLIGAFVLLWNKSESFRKMMISVGKIGLQAMGGFIKMTGLFAVALLKLVTGPMKLLLKGLSLLGVDAAGQALKGIESATNAVGKFFDSAGSKVAGLSSKLDALNKPIKIGGGKGLEIPDLGDGTGGLGTGKGKSKGGLTDKEKKEREKAREERKKDNLKYMDWIKGFQKDIDKAQKNYEKSTLSIQKDYDERRFSLKKSAAQKESKLRRDADREIAKLTKKHEEIRQKIEKDYTEKRLSIHKQFNETVGKLNKKREEDLGKLAKDNENKRADIMRAGAEKMREIVQQSMNRLKDAFKSGTAFNVTEIFKGLVEAGTASADELLKQMKNKLANIKKLAENASMLASMGFSQTFIEQVVSAGPEVGNALAESLKGATPDTIKELQATYGMLEKTTESGVDELSKTIYARSGFATKALADAYTETQADMQNALEEQARAYSEAMEVINVDYYEGLAEAAKQRDEALAEAMKVYNEAMEENAKAFQEALLEIYEDLNDALEELNRELEEALEEAQKDFEEKMAEAKAELAETLAEIQAEFEEKFKGMTNATKGTTAAIRELINELARLKAAQSGAPVGISSGVIIDPNYSSTPKPAESTTKKYSGFRDSYNVLDGNGTTVIFNNSQISSPSEAVDATVSALKYGQAITLR